MSTVQDILDAGFALSFENRPTTIATNATELVRVVDRLLKEAYQIAAKENPWYFAISTTVVKDGYGWVRPSAESVVRIQRTTGEEVIVVDPNEADMESRPALLERGKYFVSAGNAQDPTTENLEFWFSPIPTTLTAVTDSLPTQWDDAYNGILEFGVGSFLATKDSRPDEAAGLEQERSKHLLLFVNHLRIATTSAVRHTGYPRRAVSQQTSVSQGRES